jgi:Ca-activated chloride channel family protein
MHLASISRRAARWAALATVVLGVLLFTRSARADGELLLATSGGQQFPLKRTDVRAEVTGSVISATVEQTFTNPNRQRIEAVYVFPLPHGAAVDDMEMRIGSRVVRAEIRKRAEARAAYDNAVREGRHAALLEQERPNVFTFSVGNIDPGQDIQVRLHYFEQASYDAGTYEMVVPTTVGPRYVPGSPLPGPQSGTGTKADTDRVPDASRISPGYDKRAGATIGISVKLDPGMDLERVESKWHEVDVARPAASRADIKLKSAAEIPNRDFVLRWRVAAPTCKTAFFAYRPKPNEPGYISMFLEPRHDAPDGEIAPRELFFLLDTSGSMSGTPLATVVAAVKRAITTMRPGDTFQIIDFADSASSFAPRPLANTPENRTRGIAYLDHLRGAGGTNQLAGIHAALTAPGDAGRVRYVVFMTDGYIGNEREVIALTRKELGSAHIFSFGVGSSVNRYLLDEVAIAGRGKAEYLGPNEDAQALVDRFYQRIGRPYLTDISIDWGGIQVSEAEPAFVPDLSAFEPLVVHARYVGKPEGTITVRGHIAGKPYEQSFKVALSENDPERSPLERLWARARIAGIERSEAWAPGSQADTITTLALEHRLVSAYTSFVAIDSVATGGAATTQIAQPNAAPAGVNLGMAGGAYVGGSGAGSASPSRVEPEAADIDVERVHGGGCAGCTTSGSAARGVTQTGFLLLAILWLARRRRSEG